MPRGVKIKSPGGYLGNCAMHATPSLTNALSSVGVIPILAVSSAAVTALFTSAVVGKSGRAGKVRLLTQSPNLIPKKPPVSAKAMVGGPVGFARRVLIHTSHVWLSGSFLANAHTPKTAGCRADHSGGCHNELRFEDS